MKTQSAPSCHLRQAQKTDFPSRVRAARSSLSECLCSFADCSFALALFAISSFVSADALAVEHHALLIGVSDYADERITDLEGPQFDVSALRKVLIENWEYPPANIKTLVNEQATEVGILAAIDRLAAESNSGDSLLIYFSGHGTSARDNSLGAQLHLPDGSGAIVAHDFDPERFLHGSGIDQGSHDDGLLIGRYDMRPRFEALDKDRTLLVMFDACFAGNTARSVTGDHTPRTKRFISLGGPSATRGGEARPSVATNFCDDCAESVIANYPYENTVYFGAAAEHELAVDISQAEINAGLATSFDGKPHGAFTDALLRALVAGTQSPGTMSYQALFQRTLRQFQTHCEACGHTPVMLPSSVLTELAVVNLPVFQGLTVNTTLALNEAQPNSDNGDDGSELSAQNTHNNSASSLVLASADTLALAPWLAPVATRQIGNLASQAPPVVLAHNGQSIEARSVDGRLITQLNGDKDEVLDWVSTRSALQQRLIKDKATTHSFPVELAHPLHGSEFYFGEKVTFSMRVENPSRILVLSLDTAGELHRLYPVSEREWELVIPAEQTVTLPTVGSPDLRVTAPAGTDEILFYAMPVDHPQWAKLAWDDFDRVAVNFEWLDNVLAESPTRVSAAHRRLIAVAPE